MKITNLMIEASYKHGVAYYKGEISKEEAVRQIFRESKMNTGSARNAVINLKNILEGKNYFYNMSTRETIWKFDKIKEDFGDKIYQKALIALKQHIDSKNTPNIEKRKYLQYNQYMLN